ncbi:MAG: spore coat protein CotJB [Ruminococcus sp.]|nr:spore coat protein CotJB [Ruminococcus sp.]
MASEKQKALRKLQAARFAVHEANLYLDSHPTCPEGLKYFREKRALSEKLTREFEEKYGPLTAAASPADECFEWVAGAFPWERGES